MKLITSYVGLFKNLGKDLRKIIWIQPRTHISLPGLLVISISSFDLARAFRINGAAWILATFSGSLTNMSQHRCNNTLFPYLIRQYLSQGSGSVMARLFPSDKILRFSRFGLTCSVSVIIWAYFVYRTCILPCLASHKKRDTRCKTAPDVPRF